MEFGALFIVVAFLLAVVFGEKTKLGNKIISYVGEDILGLNLNGDYKN